MARPSKLTPAVTLAIVDALGIGATYVDAAGAAGVSYSTLRGWILRGESVGGGKFLKFLEACRGAEAKARLKYTQVIFTAASEGDWRAAMEFLKRRDRVTWGDSVDVTSAGVSLAPVLDLKALSKAELEKLEEIVTKASKNDTSGISRYTGGAM